MSNEPHARQVQELVERILKDTSVSTDERLRLTHLSQARRKQLVEVLRSREVPILSTEGACGPG